jgi:hypothetical protein
MKSRFFCFALVVGVLSLTSGCHCFRCMFPNAGWRFQSGWWGHHHRGPGPCCPPCNTCAPNGPIAFRPPVVVPGSGGVSVPGGYPTITYPPIIGDPMPIPGGTGVIPDSRLPSPMPDKKKDGQ